MPQIVLTGLIFTFGSIVQGAIGFGYGLICVPLLMSAGYALSEAVALTMISVIAQNAVASFQLRAHIPRQDIKLPTIVRYITMPIGMLVLLAFEDFDPHRGKQLVGVMVLVALLIRAMTNQKPRDSIPVGVSIFAFTLSGLLQGIVAMGGPPLVFWIAAKNYTSRQARAFILTVFLLNAPLQIALMMAFSQMLTVHIIWVAVGLIPFVVAGSLIGVKIGNQFSKPLLNRLALAMLLIIAINAII